MSVPASVLLWAGCKVTPENYELLSFFFDGVPDPNVPGTTDIFGRVLAVAEFQHAPYANNQCRECHTSFQQLNIDRDSSTSCLKCHGQTPREYVYMHGPVAASACLWCHEPHSSPIQHLLRVRGPELCRQCHDTGLRERAIPEHQDPERNCLICHHGHGGQDLYFLRDVVPEMPSPDDAGQGER